MKLLGPLQILNNKEAITIANKVEVASSFTSRLIGLLGRTSLEHTQCLWIKKCTSIHTFFMKFSIDVIFVDKKLKVSAIYYNVTPWKLAWPLFKKADSVFEFASGTLNNISINVGDQLHVGS